MLVKLCKVVEVHFRLRGTNDFSCKGKLKDLLLRARDVVRTSNVKISRHQFGRVHKKIQSATYYNFSPLAKGWLWKYEMCPCNPFWFRNKAHDIGQMKVAVHMEAYTYPRLTRKDSEISHRECSNFGSEGWVTLLLTWSAIKIKKLRNQI